MTEAGQWLSAVTRGRRHPAFDKVLDLAQSLGVEIGILIGTTSRHIFSEMDGWEPVYSIAFGPLQSNQESFSRPTRYYPNITILAIQIFGRIGT